MKLTLLNSVSLSLLCFMEKRGIISKEFGVFRATFSGKLMWVISIYKDSTDHFLMLLTLAEILIVQQRTHEALAQNHKGQEVWGRVEFKVACVWPRIWDEIGERLGKHWEGRFISTYIHDLEPKEMD